MRGTSIRQWNTKLTISDQNISLWTLLLLSLYSLTLPLNRSKSSQGDGILMFSRQWRNMYSLLPFILLTVNDLTARMAMMWK